MPPADFRLLIVKTSSMGDVIHTLPVLEDLARHCPGLKIDWLVEEAYAELLAMSPRLSRVIGVAERRWRSEDRERARHERLVFREHLREVEYDMVLDFQGLLKSALLSTQARLSRRGVRSGFSFRSAREPLARLFYLHGYSIGPRQHAVERLRSLAAQALGYQVAGLPRFALEVPELAFEWLARPYAVLLHATARTEKEWSEANFVQLAQALNQRGLDAVLPFGNAQEERRARAIASGASNAIVAPTLSLRQMAALLRQSRLVVGVDTGLTHLASALGVPTVGLFGATPRWRYAPYWSDATLSLGEGRQPALGRVLEAVDQLLTNRRDHA